MSIHMKKRKVENQLIAAGILQNMLEEEYNKLREVSGDSVLYERKLKVQDDLIECNIKKANLLNELEGIRLRISK